MLKNTRRTRVFIWIIAICFSGAGVAQEAKLRAAPVQDKANFSGYWRGVFILRDSIEVPFNFEVDHTGEVYLLNAEERLGTGKISLARDSLFIRLDQFDNELAFLASSDYLSGEFRKQDGTGARLPVTAEKGKKYRFVTDGKNASVDITGKYEITFISPSGKKVPAIGIFNQAGNKLTGTFLKSSGDTRFLEGVVLGNAFYLSSFLGSTPGFYRGQLSDGKISGEQIGSVIKQPFSGFLNDRATLPDPFKRTFLKDGYTRLDLSLPDINGTVRSLKEPKFQNKVIIVAITGTWCPNCIDEAEFLSPWYKKNKDRGVEVVMIHYERKTDPAYMKKVMTRFRNRFDITFDQLAGGFSDVDSVAQSLPALRNFLSFPTTIFIDRKGEVRKIHTGYSGPATGELYHEFLEEFNAEVNRLLKE